MSKNIRLEFAMALILCTAFISDGHAAPCSLAGLGWMAGSWHKTTDPARAQETWAIAPDGVLMGNYWEFPQGRTGFAEFMTIRHDGDATSMFLRHFDSGLSKAWEERAVPMVFTASSCDRESVVFDGQADHAGEHIAYRRNGNSLLITADFLHPGTPDREEWHMTRAGD